MNKIQINSGNISKFLADNYNITDSDMMIKSALYDGEKSIYENPSTITLDVGRVLLGDKLVSKESLHLQTDVYIDKKYKKYNLVHQLI